MADLDILGLPAPSDAPTPAPQPPPAPVPPSPATDDPGQQYQQKIIAARRQGFTWPQIQENQQKDWQEARDAHLSDAQITHLMGYNPADKRDAEIINRLRSHAISAGSPSAPSEWLGKLGKTLQQASDAVGQQYQAGLQQSEAALMGDVSSFARSAPGFETGPGISPGAFKTGVDAAQGALNITGIPALFGAGIHAAAGPISKAIPPGPYIDFSSGRITAGPQAGTPEAQKGIEDILGAASMALGLGEEGVAAHGALDSAYTRSAMTPEDFIAAHEKAAAALHPGMKPLAPEVRDALVRHLPPQTDFQDAAISVSPGASNARILANVDALKAHWEQTGETPSEAAQRASVDPAFRQDIITGKPNAPLPPPGSARNADGFAIPHEDAPVLPTWEAARNADRNLPPEATEAVDAWVGGPHNAIETGQKAGVFNSEKLDAAYSANPTPAGKAIRDQLRTAAQPIRDALRAEHGPVMTLYRVEGKTGNITSFTENEATATELAGGDPEKVITAQVPVGDVAWATNRFGQREVLVHTGTDGQPFSLSGNSPDSDTLAHSVTPDAPPVPKRVVKAAPVEPARDPRVVLDAVRAGPADWISNALGRQFEITSGDRPGATVAGTSRRSEHADNAAWDGHAPGMTMEQTGITLARNLREKGIPFDQVEITPTHVHIGFKPDGVGNRSEIIYVGMKPGDAAHGVVLAGDKEALPEGSLPIEETKTSVTPEDLAEKPAGLLSTAQGEEGACL